MNKINKSELMTRAWENVREMRSGKNASRNSKLSTKALLSHSMTFVWAEMKEEAEKKEMAESSKKKANNGRYIELLSIADKNGLNHGKSWVADGFTVDSKQLNPSWEGEYICYVYAA